MVVLFVQFVFTTIITKKHASSDAELGWACIPLTMDAGELKPEFISLVLPHA